MAYALTVACLPNFSSPNISCVRYINDLFYLSILVFFKQIIRQILEAHASMLNLTAMDARLTYIRNWQGLADFGISYYIVRFNKQRKDVSVKKLCQCNLR